MEGHLRTIPFWTVPVILFGIFLFDFLKKEINETKFQNYIILTLLCGITLGCWQIVHTYFWDRNVQYMKMELYKEPSLLYLPFEHNNISSFFEPGLRRYIWYNVYTPSAILFSGSYKQNNILTGYEAPPKDGNFSLREKLYIVKDSENLMSIPMGWRIHIKNKYWDLTEPAEALRIYNEEHNIKTEQ